MVVVPECSPELKPVVGQKFQSLDFAFAFYDVYVRDEMGHHESRNCPLLKEMANEKELCKGKRKY